MAEPRTVIDTTPYNFRDCQCCGQKDYERNPCPCMDAKDWFIDANNVVICGRHKTEHWVIETIKRYLQQPTIGSMLSE